MSTSATDHVFSNRNLVTLLVFCKLAFCLVILLNAPLAPSLYNWNASEDNFNSMTHNSSWAAYLKTWDANQYLFLSQHGYQPGSMANAMYPLWPLAIRLGQFIFQDELVAGVVLSNLFSFGAFWVIFRLVSAMYGRKTAVTTLVLLLAFPGSFFYCLPYSESLFLFLTASFFAAIQERKYGLAGVLAFLCPLTKAIGVFVALPYCYAIWEEWRKKNVPWSHFLLVLFPVAGYVSVMGIMFLFTGDPLAHFAAQKQYVATASIVGLFQPFQMVQQFFSVHAEHDFFHSPIDRLWFLLALGGLYFTFRADLKMFMFAIPAVLVPALTTSFMSYTRYAAVVFPIFIGYAIHFSHVRCKGAFSLTVVFLSVIQLLFLVWHINYYWVA